MSPRQYKEHVRLCGKHEFTTVEMPKKGSVCQFRGYHNTIQAPVVIYGGFETMHKKVEKVHGQTKLVNEHVPLAFSIVVVSSLPNFQPKPFNYLGQDARLQFVKKIEEIRDKFHDKYEFSRLMEFTESDKLKYNAQPFAMCYLCGETFENGHEKEPKVRDHCHFTGRYRGHCTDNVI